MKTVIFSELHGQHETSVDSYIREFKRQTNREIEIIDKDSERGAELAFVYDILQFPALAVIRDDGDMIRVWLERDKWPTVSELSFYK